MLPTILCIYFIIPHREQTSSFNTIYENDQGLLRKSYVINTVCEQNSEIIIYQQMNFISVLENIKICMKSYEGWNFNSGNYLFTTDTK